MFDDPSMIRFIVMPVVGVLLGIRDGHLDAKAASPPFDYTMQDMVKATYIPFFMMTFISILAQANSGRGVNMLEAFGMGGLCAGLLYTLARNLSNQAFSGARLSTRAGASSVRRGAE